MPFSRRRQNNSWNLASNVFLPHKDRERETSGNGGSQGTSQGRRLARCLLCSGLIVAWTITPATAAFITVSKLGGKAILNSRPAFVGDRLIKQGDTLKSTSKGWAGMTFSVKAHATIGGGSAVKVRSLNAGTTNIAVTGHLKIKIQTGAGKISIGGAGTVTRSLSTIWGVNIAGLGHCAAVEEGEVIMETEKGFTQQVAAGQVSCSFDSEQPSSPTEIDKELTLEIASPRVVDGVKVCTIAIAPTNMLVRIDGDSASPFDISPSGEYSVSYQEPRRYRVLNALGAFKNFQVQDCG